MKLTLAEPRGFCAGVNRAINILNEVVQSARGPVYVYHEIVHNSWVVRDFNRRGVIFVDSLDDVPDNAVLLFSAHGVSPEIRELAAQRRIRTIDATCPRVHYVHKQMRNLADDGYHVVFIGKPGHDEVVGVLGEAPGSTTLISKLEEVEALDVSAYPKVAYLMQTTLSATEATQIVDALRKKIPNLLNPSREGICDATQLRQDSVRRLAPGHDLVLVVGSPNSSNSQNLAKVARSVGVPAVLIDGVEDIPWNMLTPESSVLITSGASAPDIIVKTCVQFLNDI